MWRARDELLGREVALKRVPLAGEGHHRRATREALAAARLAHPAIVALYEACADDDAFYLISYGRGPADIGLCSSNGCVQSDCGRHQRHTGRPT